MKIAIVILVVIVVTLSLFLVSCTNKKTSPPTGTVTITHFQYVTQSTFDIITPDSSTIYFIVENKDEETKRLTLKQHISKLDPECVEK